MTLFRLKSIEHYLNTEKIISEDFLVKRTNITGDEIRELIGLGIIIEVKNTGLTTKQLCPEKKQYLATRKIHEYH